MSTILELPVWLTGQTTAALAVAIAPEQAEEPEGLPNYQTETEEPKDQADRAKRLQALLGKVSDAAHTLARSATVARIDIGRHSSDYIRLRLKGETDAGVIRASRAAALKRIQSELNDALGNQEAPEIEDCLRLHGVASVYGLSEANKLGIGQLRCFEPTVKRATGKNAKPESWSFKATLEAGAVDALKALFSSLASGERVLTAAETSIEVRRILGKGAKQAESATKPDQATGMRAEKAAGTKPALTIPSGPAEDASRINALLCAPHAKDTCRLIGQAVKWNEEMVKSLVSGLVDGGHLQALTALVKEAIAVKTEIAKRNQVAQAMAG